MPNIHAYGVDTETKADMAETFKDIPGYEGLYKISDKGNVKSLARTMVVKRKNATPYDYRKEELLLDQNLNSEGYPTVSLCSNGKCKTYKVHRLVAETFIGPRPDKMETCHNDGDKSHNNVSNLRYDAPKGNGEDKVKHGTQARGEKMGSTRRTDQEILRVKEMLKTMSGKEVTRLTGIPSATLSNIKNGLSWKHL